MQLSKRTKILHMAISAAMIFLLVIGIYMAETETFFLYPIHKSIGVIVFIFAVIRVINRIREGWPRVVGKASQLQLGIAKLVHWALIIMTVLYPVSGMMMSGGGGHGITVFGLELLASNHDDISGKTIALNETVASIGHYLHETLTAVLILFIVVHVAGALKHHFVDKDQTITRMFSFK